MSRSRAFKVVVTVLTCVGLLAVTAPAEASWTDNVAYRRQWSTCQDNGDGTMNVGAGVYMKEIGQHGVVQLRTKYLLYTEDPNSSGIHVAARRKTVQSQEFPNDQLSYHWGSDAGNRWTWQVDAGEYWLVAKLTWARLDQRRDWNYKLPVAHCALQIG